MLLSPRSPFSLNGNRISSFWYPVEGIQDGVLERRLLQHDLAFSNFKLSEECSRGFET